MTINRIENREQMTGLWRVTNDAYDVRPDSAYTVADLAKLAQHWDEWFTYEPANGRVVDSRGAVVAERAQF